MLKILALIIVFISTTAAFAQTESKYIFGDDWKAFPHESVFKPLVADPEWPKMAVGYRYYTSQPYVLQNTLDFALGRTIPVLRKDFGGVEVEFALQGLGLLGFDLDDNTNIVYGDFFVGAPLFFKFTDNLIVMARYYHRSSHLGDETMINAANADPEDKNYGLERINLSYEVLDLLLSYQINDILRIYGGGGVVSDPQPYRYGSSVYQLGVEAEYQIFTGSTLIGAVDLKGTAGVPVGVVLKTGVKAFERATVTFEIQDGAGPAQFFDERVTSYAINLNFY